MARFNIRTLRTAQRHAKILHPQWVAFVASDIVEPKISRYRRMTPEQRAQYAVMCKAWVAKNKAKLAQRQAQRRKARRIIGATFKKLNALSLLGGWARRGQTARKQTTKEEIFA